jgi:putative oxidoreductase
MTVEAIRTLWDRLDRRMVQFMAIYGRRLMRISLGIIFIWFGALKVIGRSPVAELVASTVPWVSPGFFVPFLGVWEMIVGIGLLFNLALRLTLFLFWLQLAGTFLVLVSQPKVAFQGGNPLLLTTEGEFVIKNLVLIAGGLVVGSGVRRPRQ